MTASRRRLERIAFVASARPEAREAMLRMRHLYGSVKESDADVIVALGGDGLMLETLRRHMDDGIPVFGLNQGTIGFLMNDYREGDLPDRIAAAKASVIHPLRMSTVQIDGQIHDHVAINEVSLLRQTVRLRLASPDAYQCVSTTPLARCAPSPRIACTL